MSVWPKGIKATGEAGAGLAPAKVTVPGLLAKKKLGQRISAVTAYDCASARLVDAAGLDVLLVGDSLAMVMMGHDSTLEVTMEEMLVFTRAARRGVARALLVADMPYGSYQVEEREGVRNALRFVKEAGAEAVKLEGGRERVDLVKRLVDAEIAVMGHVGLTPQSVHRMGGYKVQARTEEAASRLREDAHLLASAGCFCLVLEGIPREVAATLTAELPVPTIGIGAGPDCDGQVLVWHDLLGLDAGGDGSGRRAAAKFVRRYAEGGAVFLEALENYRRDVEAGAFPADEESYHVAREARRTTAGFQTV